MALKLPPLDARIPKWDLDHLIERSCPICNSYDAHTAYERPDDLNVQICRSCSTFFVSPSPSDEQLQAFYEDYDEQHRRVPRINGKELAALYAGVDPLTDLRIRELSSFMKFEASRVLDIGFGRAYFLYCLKTLGAIPFGVELDTKAIELAQFLGMNVFQGHLVDYVSETKFELITLIDVVEHPLNPMDILRKSSELLQRGGFLLIWTPNGDAACLEISPTIFRVDLEHMQYLTPETCLFIASELKLRVVHLETVGFPVLEGIDKPFSKNETPVRPIKKMIKSIPGFSTVNSFRHKLFKPKQDEKNKPDERMGVYHLFCIMQKPA
jgi:2-polyprenyl-3-methyl-5-hydroxy-6-metoxy-1,4-benzoquinol methylase